MDLNVGLNQTKTNKHRERTKGPKETYDVDVNDSLDDESVEEDEVLQKMLQQHGDKMGLNDSIAEEVEEEQLSGDRILAKDRISNSDGLVASPSSNTIIATKEVQETENSPTIKTDSPWKLTVEHEPSKLFDSLDLSMSMRQSLNLEIRRKAVADEKEEEAVVESTVPSPKKHSREKKNVISTNLKVQSSANALTPSKVVENKNFGNNINHKQNENPKAHTSPSMIKSEFLLEDRYAIIETERLKPSWLRKKKNRRVPKENNSAKSNYTGSVKSYGSVASRKKKKPWGRGKLSKKQQMALETTKRRKLYQETLRKRAEQERLERRKTLRRRRPTSSQFEQESRRRHVDYRDEYQTARQNSDGFSRRQTGTASYATTYLDEQLPPSRYTRNENGSGENGMNWNSNISTTTSNYRLAKTKSWIEEHAQYSLNRRPSSTSNALSVVSAAETALTNYTSSKSDSNTAVARRRREHLRYGRSQRPSKSARNYRRRKAGGFHGTSNENRQLSTPQIFSHYNPSDESIEEEKIKASIERLENRLKSKQIMALRRGSSATLRAAGSRYLKDNSAVSSTANNGYNQSQQLSTMTPVIVENHHHHYNYDNSGSARPLPSFTNSAMISTTQETHKTVSSHRPPRSPGPPPPPPPVEYCNNDSQFMANSQPVKNVTHHYYHDKNALSKQTQPSCVAPPGLVNGSRALNATASSNTGPKKNHTNAFQPCHIMKKPNSYALLKQQEKESRSHLRARNNQSTLKLQSRQGMSYQEKSVGKAPKSKLHRNRSKASIESSLPKRSAYHPVTDEVASTCTESLSSMSKVRAPATPRNMQDTVNNDVLVNEMNLHLLMTPTR